jgi:serine phosphatase RsbU (regulator of sigma subunit)/CheY-like chemotaxis protein
MPKPVILCVDDEKVVLDSLTQQLRYHLGDQYDFEVAESGEEALELADDLLADGQHLAVMISDQLMPGIKGDELLAQLHRRSPDTLKVLLTGQASAEAIGRAVNHAKLYRYLAKPWDKTDLLLTIEEAAKSYLSQQQVRQQNALLAALHRTSRVLGAESQLRPLLTNLLQVAGQTTGATRAICYLPDDGQLRPALALARPAPNQAPQNWDTIIAPELPDELLMALQTQPQVLHRTGEALHQLWGTSPAPAALLALPITAPEQADAAAHVPQGALLLLSDSQPHAFHGLAQEYLRHIGPEVWVALERAALYDGLERRVHERTEILQRQSQIIEQKNRDITDSIRYASRIQQAVVPQADELQVLFPESFVVYQPRDVISGDFYWCAQVGQQRLLAVVDCTGHGVPGAMLAVLAASLLHQIIQAGDHTQPAAILVELNRLVRQRLLADGHGPKGALAADTLDVAICCFDPQRGSLRFAGANRPIYFVRQGKLHICRTVRQSIGAVPVIEAPAVFAQEEILLYPGDTVYMFSDGVADQFGGEHNRKFTPARLQDLLLEANPLPMPTAGDQVHQALRHWQGSEPQTDDMVLVGLRFTDADLAHAPHLQARVPVQHCA